MLTYLLNQLSTNPTLDLQVESKTISIWFLPATRYSEFYSLSHGISDFRCQDADSGCSLIASWHLEALFFQ